MARQSLLRKYLLIATSILVVTFLSVYLIQRTFEQTPDPTVQITGLVTEESMVTLVIQDEPSTLDPTRQESFAERMVCTLLYQSLFEDAGGSVVASDLIEQVKEEQSILTIDLNPFKVFHSGRRVGAEDVKYSIERAIRMANSNSPKLIRLLEGLKGLDKYLSGATEGIDGIQILDGNSISIEWSGDINVLKRILGLPQFAILEKTTLLQNEEYGAFVAEGEEPSINGTGSFRIIAWDDDFLALEPIAVSIKENANRLEICFDERLDSILYGLRMGEYDAALVDTAIGEEKTFFLAESEGWKALSSGEVLYMKTGIPKTPEINKVLILALNRSSLRQALGWGRVLESSPELSAGLDQMEVFYENPEIAQSTWEQIKDQQIELQIGYIQHPKMELVASTLSEEYRNLGITAKMVGFEKNEDMEIALKNGSIHAYLNTYYADSRLYQNGAYLQVEPLDIESGMKYVPLLQNEQYYRFGNEDDIPLNLSKILVQ